MAITINVKDIKKATPWNAVVATLVSLEEKIGHGEHDAMTANQQALKARWSFGRELVKRRVDYKGRLTIPKDLMQLAMAQCKLSKKEINQRVRFADKYPTKELMSDAIRHYPSWYRMTHKGLVEKSTSAKTKKPAKSSKQQGNHSREFIGRKLNQGIEKAFANLANVTRDEVKFWEQVRKKIDLFLMQIDQNDDAKADRKVDAS